MSFFFNLQLRTTRKLNKINSKSKVGMEGLYSTYFPTETYNGKWNVHICHYFFINILFLQFDYYSTTRSTQEKSS